MNIIISDIDPIIVSLTELPELVNLGCVCLNIFMNWYPISL